MKNSKYLEDQEVLYMAEFGRADHPPSTFRIFRYASEIEWCHGVLDETEVMTSYTFASFPEALEYLSKLIVTGRHRGHDGINSHDYCQTENIDTDLEPKRGESIRLRG